MVVRQTRIPLRFLSASIDPLATTTPRGLPAWGPRFARGTDTLCEICVTCGLALSTSKFAEHAHEVIGMFFLDRQNPFEHSARG
jgi:hypothetical protein